MTLSFQSDHPVQIARSQVALPSGAFIRALPFSVEEVQRFRADALVVCADIVSAAYLQLVELAIKAAQRTLGDDSEGARHLDVALFQHAWSMVDQVYTLRLLMKSLEFSGVEVEGFMAASAQAYVLRNRMDHLDQRIPNIAASQSQTRSLFGSLAYLVQGEALGVTDIGGYLVVQHAEPLRPQERLGEIAIPDQARWPIGNFTLSAAGERLDLDALILTLGPVMTSVNARIEQSINAKITAAVKEQGIEESTLRSHFGAGHKFMLALSLDLELTPTDPCGA